MILAVVETCRNRRISILISAFNFRVDYISVTFRIALPLLTHATLSPWIIALVSVVDVSTAVDLSQGCCMYQAWEQTMTFST